MLVFYVEVSTRALLHSGLTVAALVLNTSLSMLLHTTPHC